MPKEDKVRNEKGTKRVRKSSQADDKVQSSILERLVNIEEKLAMLVKIVLGLEGYLRSHQCGPKIL